MSGLIEGVGALLDRRALTSSWVPVLAFLLGLGAVVVAALGPADAVAAWNGLGGTAQAALAAVLLVGTVVLAGLLSASRLSLVRWLEGYLPRGWRWLERMLRVRHEHLRHRLAPNAPERHDYPRERGEVEVRPTRVGNIIAAGEQYPERYEIDAAATWPRLYPVLPESFTAAFTAASASLETMAALWTAGAAFAVVGGGFAVLVLPWWGTLLCVLAGTALAVAARAGAEQAARTYAALVRSAYDVHRGLLIDAMGLQRAPTFGQEKGQWRQLRKVWTTGRPDSGHARLLGYPARPPKALEQAPSDPAATATSPAPGSVSAGSPALTEPPPTQPTATTSAPEQQTSTPRPPTGRRQRAVLLALLVLLASVMVGATEVRTRIVTIVPGHGDELRAQHDLPAYVPLACTDIRDTRGPTAPRDVVGRYPLAALRTGAVVVADRLGPRLPAGAMSGRSVTTVTAAAPSAVGALVRGQRVALVRLPPDPPSRPPTTVSDVLVLDVLTVSPSTSLVVAAPQASLVDLGGPGTLLVLTDFGSASAPVPPPNC